MSKKTGRNDPCPCGSGKKYKKCCLDMGIRNPNANKIRKLKKKIKDNERKIKENEVRMKRYNETIKENEKEIEENKKQIKMNKDISNKKSKEIGNIKRPITSVNNNNNTSHNGSSANNNSHEGGEDKIIQQLKDLIYKDNEYPYVVHEREDSVEVHSICKHGICRIGYDASPIDREDVEGPWESDSSWDGDECMACDAEICPGCGKRHILVCPQCHENIDIELTEDEAMKAYKEGRDIFINLRCDKCGSNIFKSIDTKNRSI